MGSKILEITNLVKKYNSGFNLEIGNLFLDENEILVLIGPNGSGKSTLIRLINLLEKPDSGNIIFNGINILGSNVDKVQIRKRMSVVFQEPLLFNTSVYNNIMLGLNFRKRKLVGSNDLFEYLVEKLKIKNLLRRNPKSLSGGEQQRVALARALVLEPELLLLDEPLANIDQVSREELRQDLFDIIRNTKRSTIYVTHDRNEAMIIADDVAVINEGIIEQFGHKNEVFRKPVNTFVAKFVGVETILEGTVVGCRNNVCSVKIADNSKISNSNGRSDDVDINKINNSSNYISDINYVLNSNLEIYVVSQSEINSEVLLAIRPEDVTLHNIEMSLDSSSAMNSFIGVVSDIQDIGIFKKIEMDCGFKLISFVTQNSVERLGIEIGKKIIASVKASSIHMFKK